MRSLIILFILLTGLFSCSGPTEKPVKPNVLFIAVDDLRPELNCYGNKQIISPNIDKLAQGGVLFTRAYCNIPVCGASRASLLTGLRPARNRFLTYYTYADEDAPDVVCLPRHFKDNGYITLSNGKVFHHQDDRADSWNENWRPRETSSWRDYLLPENIKRDIGGKTRGPAYECVEVPDSAYFDGKIALKTIRDLERLKQKGEPFFLAAGFLKPHLPFNAPSRYWDLYPYDEVRLPDNNYQPEEAPDIAMTTWGELRQYQNIPAKGPLSDSIAKKLIQGYHACVSYTDAQIGKVLFALKDLGLDKNTIVVLWGDHGWNLREHGLWCKHCLFHNSLHATLIVKAPWITRGDEAEGLVEFVDIYPTLCELAGLPCPGHLEGKSFMEILENPEVKGKEGVVSQWHEGLCLNTGEFSYTEWRNNKGKVFSRMLYNHDSDPEENVNVSEKNENQKIIVNLQEFLNENQGENYWK